jgi:hypothetical protein
MDLARTISPSRDGRRRSPHTTLTKSSILGVRFLEGTLDAPKYPPYGLFNDVNSGIFGALGAYADAIGGRQMKRRLPTTR